jgi:hypothetical protein
MLGLTMQGGFAQFFNCGMSISEIQEAKLYADPSAFADSVAAHTIRIDDELPICREIMQFMRETDFSDIYGAIAKRMKQPVDSLVFYPIFYCYANSAFEDGNEYLNTIRLCKRPGYKKSESRRSKYVRKRGGFLTKKDYFALCEKYACITRIEIYDVRGYYLRTLDLHSNSAWEPFVVWDPFGNINQYPAPLFIVATTDWTYLYFLNEKEFIFLEGGALCWPSSFSSYVESDKRFKLWTMMQLETQYPQEEAVKEDGL